MKFLYDTEVLNISDCIGGMFVVTIEDKSREREYNYIPSYSYLMDKNGVISDRPFKRLYSESALGHHRTDGFFVMEQKEMRTLVDSSSQVVATGFKEVSQFAPNGFARIKFEDRSFWMNKQGKLFGQEYEDVGEFVNGYATAQLKNGKTVYVDEKFNVASEEFDFAFPHYVKNFFLVKSGDKYIALRQNFERYGSAEFDRPVVVSEYGYYFDLEFDKQPTYSMYDMNGNKILTADNIGNCENQRIIRVKLNGKYFFFDQKKKKFLGLEEGFIYAEDFNGSMAVVGLGYDREGEMIMTFLKSDGTLFKDTYPAAEMLDRNLGAVYDSTKRNVGMFRLIGPNEVPSLETYGEPKTVSDGMMFCLDSRKRWRAVDKNRRELPGSYQRVQNFSEGFAVVENNNTFDVITTKGVSLREISKFAQKIIENPNNFIDLPKNFQSDPELVQRLFDLAWSEADRLMRGESKVKIQLSEIRSKFEQCMAAGKTKIQPEQN